MDAILVHFVGQVLALGDLKTEMRKKPGRAREEAYAADGVASRFLHQRGDQQAADTESLRLRCDGDGSNFGKMRPVQVKGSAADDLAVFFGDYEIADVFGKLRFASRQKYALTSVGLYDGVDLVHVGQNGIAGFDHLHFSNPSLLSNQPHALVGCREDSAKYFSRNPLPSRRRPPGACSRTEPAGRRRYNTLPPSRCRQSSEAPNAYLCSITHNYAVLHRIPQTICGIHVQRRGMHLSFKFELRLGGGLRQGEQRYFGLGGGVADLMDGGAGGCTGDYVIDILARGLRGPNDKAGGE